MPWLSEDRGREIKVYDDTREAREWTSLVGPTQCAVFFKDVNTDVPLTPDGGSVARLRDCTFVLFDSLEAARNFCQGRVSQFPNMCCELFDCEGKAKSPLLVIMHPSSAKKDELSVNSVRKRTIAAILLFLGAPPLFWWDWNSGGALILPTYLGITMIVAGLRLLYWNQGLAERIQEQDQRLRVHLRRETEMVRGDSPAQQE